MALIEVRGLTYRFGNNNKKVLNGIDMDFEAGKMYAVLGPSGSGKSTFLSLLGGLDEPLGGNILFDGEEIGGRGLAYHRRRRISFIFQNYNLIDYMTAEENVNLTGRHEALLILGRLGITAEEARRGVLKLSGGQQQRVAIARGLISLSPVILADEPTGNLDEQTAADITGILRESASELNKCVIVATHSSELAGQADVVLRLRHGLLQKVP